MAVTLEFHAAAARGLLWPAGRADDTWPCTQRASTSAVRADPPHAVGRTRAAPAARALRYVPLGV